jgi:serine/threonine protein kinase
MEGPTGPTTGPVESGDRALIGLRVKGRYRIVRELGAGAFGNVYLAEDEATAHPVAVRFLPRALASAPHAAQAVQRMGRSIVAASTAHPALVRVPEFGEAEDGRAFAAMEFVEGRRLSELLSGGKPLDVGAALRLALELGGAVETLHNMGVVHGALRPRNVMVLEDGRVKLMDLELAGLRDTPAMEGVLGAEPPAEYLSPEQIRRAAVTEKTDIYAFGVILYEMLCGVPPFQAPTREAVLAKHLTETPVPMRRRQRAVPASVESAVALALYKQPELRPLMQDVLNRLWAEANGPATRWKRTAAIVGGAALAASIAGLVAWSLFAQRPSTPPPLAQPAPPPPAAEAPVSAPPTSRAPAVEPRPAPPGGPMAPVVGPPSPTVGRATPAVVPSPAARATPPSTPPPGSRPAGVERRDQPRGSQAPAGAALERPALSSDADDPGAIIDWLLNRPSAGGR